MSNKLAQTQKKREFKTNLIKYQDNYMNMIEEQCLQHSIVLDEYQKQCARNALTGMAESLKAKGKEFSDPQMDQSSVTDILQTVSTLRLNAAAMPREVYFITRNFQRDGKWMTKLEMGIEGDGNDALLRHFGVNINKVGAPWLVREDDGFEYPEYTGFQVTPPRWIRGGIGKVVRVVYPLLLNDGTTEYLISERADVKPNLLAHINNNLRNETFGVVKSRYEEKVTDEQREKMDEKKAEILAIARSHEDLESILDDPKLDKWISPAWKGDNREQMIIRKMRNNAVKKYPKNFGNAFVAASYASMDDDYKSVQDDIDNEPRRVIDITPEDEVELELLPALEEKEQVIESEVPSVEREF